MLLLLVPLVLLLPPPALGRPLLVITSAGPSTPAPEAEAECSLASSWAAAASSGVLAALRTAQTRGSAWAGR